MGERYLQVLSGARAGTAVRLDGGITLGRAPTNQLPFAGEDAQWVSSRHAVIQGEGGAFLLRDLASTNGTYINGERVTERFLRHGDLISLGREGPKLRFVEMPDGVQLELPGVTASGRPGSPPTQAPGGPGGEWADAVKLSPRRPATRVSVPVEPASPGGGRSMPARAPATVGIDPDATLPPTEFIRQGPAPGTGFIRQGPTPGTGQPAGAAHGGTAAPSSPASGHAPAGVSASSTPPTTYLRPGAPASLEPAPPPSEGQAREDGPARAGVGMPQEALEPAGDVPPVLGEHTMVFVRKLKSDRVDPEELQALIKDTKRVSRLVNSGLLSKRDAQMIVTASTTYHRSRRHAVGIVASISVVAAVLVGVLTFQNVGYRGKLNQQEKLVATIGALETQLRSGQSGGESEKEALVARLRDAERRLTDLRDQLNTGDQARTYKNPLGAEIEEIMKGFGKQGYLVPDEFIAQVERHIKTLTTVSRFILTRSFANKPRYQQLIEDELVAAGLPTGFLYLSMHESMLDPEIISTVGARGLWQLMPGTAREFGLKVPENWRDLPPEKDERTNPALSTRIGIKYLKRLLADFGDAPLAMAAYNSGPGTVRKALRELHDPINNRDFWFVYRLGTLPPETNEYVPKIIATMIVDRRRKDYGFTE